MTFRETARDAEPSITAVAPGGLATAEEPETRVALEEEAEETPRPEPVEAGASPRGEDPVRLYLKEIGKVPLLTAAQVAQVRRRWERIGQLAEEARRNRTAAARELSELQKEVGLPRRQISQFLEQIERSDRTVRQAKRELMEANLRLVVSVAKRYLGSDLTLLDLVQEGNIGLMKAVDRFQYRRGFKFSTYATWWIRQAITRAIADH